MYVFGTGKLIAIPTNDATGAAIANPTPVQLGTLQDVSLDLGVDIKKLYGEAKYPVAIGQGKGNTDLKAKYANINGGVLGSLFMGRSATAGIKAPVFDFATAVPGTGPYTVTVVPPSSGTFVADLGVVNLVTGNPMTRVASAPVAGQYSVAGAVYTFAAADSGLAIALNYEYSASSTTGQVFNLTNDLMGYTPSFSILLSQRYDGKTLVVKLNRAVSGKLNMPLKNDDFSVFDFEATAFADSANSLGYICFF
jgi:hypothetical protein